MPKSLIGLGANLEHRATVLRKAVERLHNHPELRVLGVSRVYETLPVGGPDGQNAFLNAAVLLESEYDPLNLLLALQELEDACGRTRSTRWGPRVIDLDLLLHGAVDRDSRRLTIPHPRMSYRRFVLHPACDVAREMLHPTTGRTLKQLLNHLNRAPNYIAFDGGTAAERDFIMKSVKQKMASHGIILDRKSNHCTNPGIRGNTWLMDDLCVDHATLAANKDSDMAIPKLTIFLHKFITSDSDRQSSLLLFPAPQLHLTYSDNTHIETIDEVTAAILAIAILPIPMKNLSLQGP